MIDPAERKQNYLCDEIIEQGYDPEAFMVFMSESKEDGTNIDRWGMAELINIVSEYKKSFTKSGQPINNMNDNQSNYASNKVQSTFQSIQPAVQESPPIQNYTSNSISSSNSIPQSSRTQSRIEVQQPKQQQVEPPKTQQLQYNQSNFQSMYQPPPPKPSGTSNLILNLLEDEDPFESISVPTISNNQSLHQSSLQARNNATTATITTSATTNQNTFQSFFVAPVVPASQSKIPSPQPYQQSYASKTNIDVSDPFGLFAQEFNTTTITPAAQKKEKDPFGDFFSPQPTRTAFAQEKTTQNSFPRGSENKSDNFSGTGAQIGNSNTNSSVIPAPIAANPISISKQNSSNINNLGQQQQQQSQQIKNRNLSDNEVNFNNFKQPEQSNTPATIKQESQKIKEINNLPGQQQKACKLSTETSLGKEDKITIQIKDHLTVSGSLFTTGGNITLYLVNTLPQNWVVKRKQADFVWLRNILLRLHPGTIIPPLPSKTAKSVDDKLIRRRKGYFENFLSDILTFPALKSSKALNDFLSVTDDKIFRQKMKELDKQPSPKSISELESPTGTVILNQSTAQCNLHAANLIEYALNNDNLYNKLQMLSKKLLEGYLGVENTLYAMGDVFTQLHTNTINFNAKSGSSIAVRELEETYKLMNNMCSIQANNLLEQSKTFSNEFYNFFKFHKENLVGLKAIVKLIHANHLIIYCKETTNGGTGSIFSSSRESVCVASKNVKELEEQVAFFNEQIISGSKKALENRYKAYAKHFMEFCQNQSNSSNILGKTWLDISDSLKSILLNEQSRRKTVIMKKLS